MILYLCLFVINLWIVYIGKRMMIGLNVRIYIFDYFIFFEVWVGLIGEEWGKIVRIEEDCWICGFVIILFGVIVGKGSIVVVGVVVMKDIFFRSLVMGNFVCVVKKILEDGIIVKV